MRVRMFAIRDLKVEAFMTPYFAMTDAQAVRMFGDSVNEAGSALNRHTDDYSLFRIGEWDDQSGQVLPEMPAFIVEGVALKRREAPAGPREVVS